MTSRVTPTRLRSRKGFCGHPRIGWELSPLESPPRGGLSAFWGESNALQKDSRHTNGTVRGFGRGASKGAASGAPTAILGQRILWDGGDSGALQEDSKQANGTGVRIPTRSSEGAQQAAPRHGSWGSRFYRMGATLTLSKRTASTRTELVRGFGCGAPKGAASSAPTGILGQPILSDGRASDVPRGQRARERNSCADSGAELRRARQAAPLRGSWAGRFCAMAWVTRGTAGETPALVRVQ